MTVHDLPAVNASLNALSAVCLFAGWVAIRRKQITVHRTFMITALAVSAAFLTCYLIYHAEVGSVKFRAEGWIRPVYLGILLFHTVLAAILPFLAAITVWRAARGQFARHRRIARVTWPIWMTVSVTGVVVYWLLYHVEPGIVGPR